MTSFKVTHIEIYYVAYLDNAKKKKAFEDKITKIFINESLIYTNKSHTKCNSK